MSLEKVKIKLLTKDAKVIKRSEDSIGYDIFASEDVVIPGIINVMEEYLATGNVKELNHVKISTGISLACPLEYGEFIMSRSSMGANGLVVLGGVIDPLYRGEIKVMLANIAPFSYKVNKGDKVAQMIFKLIEMPDIEIVEELDETKRGNKGFGEYTGR